MTEPRVDRAPPENEGRRRSPLVGVGASAGRLAAFWQFLQRFFKKQDHVQPAAARLAEYGEHAGGEMSASKEYLHSLVEQQDSANEGLRAANEEIHSSNEEPQSTNEELEKAKEELQSANEELTTVNEQLQHRHLELIQANNDLTNLLSSLEIPVVMVGSDLRIRRFTGPARRILSLLPGDVGRPIGDIRGALDLADLESLVADVIQRVSTVEQDVRDKQGRWYMLRISPYQTPDDKVEGAILLLIDVDQARRGKEELLLQGALVRQYAALLELSHDAIVVRDSEHRVQFWNRGAEETYGYTAAEAQGHVLDVLLHTDQDDWKKLNATLNKRGFWEGELRQRRRDGMNIIVEVRETLSRDERGDRLTILSIKRDVTEAKRVLKDLKLADRRKDQFLATLAHELRNPIAPIRNAAEILRLGTKDTQTIKEVSDILDRQVRQLAAIVEDLIDVSRIVEKKIELRMERVSVDRVVSMAVETSRSLIQSCGHQLSVSLPSEPVYVDADPTRLSQVLVNLLNNAAKFTPRGGSVSLSAKVEIDGMHDARPDVAIRVRDNGIGITEESLKRVFEMFEQGAVLPGQGTSGLGVGLTLVRSLVNMHGGTVEASSEGPGLGSEFVVRLPVADPAADRPGKPSQDASARGTNIAALRRKILIVDDNRDQAESLGLLLKLTGHRVMLTFDGDDALRAAAEFRPDVAVLDLGLPKRNGYDVAAFFRSDPKLKDTLLVAQTGWGQEHDRERARRAGFDHYLVKPVDLGELRAIIEQPRGNSSSDHALPA